ncbi:MAG: sigma-70 family RNA polymerase sigma factor [Bacteroidia bacterium]
MSEPDKHSLSDPALWAELYNQELFSFARWKLNDDELARDFVQEALLAGYEKRDSFRGDSSEKTWLLAILRNKILDYYRSKYRKPDIISRDSGNTEYFDKSGHWTGEQAPQTWPEAASHKIESAEFYRVLTACRDQLSGQQQLVFVLKYMEDKDAGEICKELNISPSNYWVLLHRARLQLRRCLEINWINA